jgi:hypothetical protein
VRRVTSDSGRLRALQLMTVCLEATPWSGLVSSSHWLFVTMDAIASNFEQIAERWSEGAELDTATFVNACEVR